MIIVYCFIDMAPVDRKRLMKWRSRIILCTTVRTNGYVLNTIEESFFFSLTPSFSHFVLSTNHEWKKSTTETFYLKLSQLWSQHSILKLIDFERFSIILKKSTYSFHYKLDLLEEILQFLLQKVSHPWNNRDTYIFYVFFLSSIKDLHICN